MYVCTHTHTHTHTHGAALDNPCIHYTHPHPHSHLECEEQFGLGLFAQLFGVFRETGDFVAFGDHLFSIVSIEN